MIKSNTQICEQLICLLDHCWVIGVEITWRQLPLIEAVEYKPQDPRIKVLGHVKLEITLQHSLAQSLRKDSVDELKETWFTENAFKPRTFIITIEGGDFVPDHMADASWARMVVRTLGGEKEARRRDSRYALRLCFNHSPYPEVQNMKESDHTAGVLVGPLGDKRVVAVLVGAKHAVGRQKPPVSETHAAGRAMNDPAPLGCIIS